MKLKLTSQYTLPIGTLILTAGGVIFGLLPLLSSIDNVQKEIATTRLDLATIQEQQKDTSRSQNEAELTSQKAALDRMFISTNQVLEFLSLLEERADDADVEEAIIINDFPETGTGNIIEQPISIDATGSYSNIMDYLQKLEAIDYYINVESVTLTGTSTATSGAQGSIGAPTVVSTPTESTRLNLTGTSFWKSDL